ncbi:MAG: hypothetical protein GY870_10855, partial [archaeon]|nr:hypothetical protein [archaeon]
CTDYALKRKKTVFPYSILARDTTRKEEDNFKDPYTLSLPQNTMSIYWTVDFLRCMHENTKEQKYLDLGSYVLDYLSTFQQLFNAPFLEFDGFGGFCSQNNDAEWSDTRQALNTWELMEFYFLTGEEMYLERAIAGMKSCYVLVLHEKNKQVAPGNFKWIDEDDYGANFENYGHQGFNHPVQGAVTIDWSWGSSTMAYIMLRNKLGDLFIDLEKCKAYGVNACAVQETDMDNGILSIKAKILPEMPKLLIKILALKESRSNFNSIKLINLSSKKEYIIEIDEEFDQITIEL